MKLSQFWKLLIMGQLFRFQPSGNIVAGRCSQLLLRVVRCLPSHSGLSGCGETQVAGVGQASREETAGGAAVSQKQKQSVAHLPTGVAHECAVCVPIFQR
jgi:hypothetical protein